MRNATTAFKRGIFLAVSLCLLTGAFTALAATEGGKKLLGFRPSVKIALSANIERDKKLQSVDKQTLLKSGEVLYWELVSENEGNASAEGYKAAAKIPAGTIYIAGTAKGDASANALFSIDGGKNFSEKPLIDEKQTDGTIKQVPAPVSMYTDILFKWETALEAGQKLRAGYQVAVK